MHHFFTGSGNIDPDAGYATIDDGADFNHAVNVLRVKKGEPILLSDPSGRDYVCRVEEIVKSGGDRHIRLRIEEAREENNELPSEIKLFQCLPKSDKMELIIQKAVELGASEIVPVISKNCVARPDEGRMENRLQRWRNIALNAARQSERSVVPRVLPPIRFREAVEECSRLGIAIMPYEGEKGTRGLSEAIINFLPGRSAGVIVGPEGGFDPLEVSMAERHGVMPVSLGKRILRTETAAIAVLSLIMIRLEIASEQAEDRSG